MSRPSEASLLVRDIVIQMQLHPEQKTADLTDIAKKYYTTLGSARSSFKQIADRLGGGLRVYIKYGQVYYEQEEEE